jgi:hypothetical protein
MLAVSFAPGGWVLPATKGRGWGCVSANSEPPDNCGDCSHTTARPGDRSGIPDSLSVVTTSRLRGGLPGLASGTFPASATTIVSFPSRNDWPNRAVLGSIISTLVGTPWDVDVDVEVDGCA